MILNCNFKYQRLVKRFRVIGGITSTIVLCLSAGCATTTSGKVYQNMALAGAAGAIYGSTQQDYKTTQAVLYGSLAAAIAAATTIYFEDPDKEQIRLRNELKSLKAKLDQINEPKLVGVEPATFGARIPAKYKNMIQPGEWKVFELDQWVEDGDNRLIHQDKVMELTPPSLKPN